MEDVPHAIEVDTPPPPLPPREDIDIEDGRAASCHSIESHSMGDTEPEGGSGYVCRTSFKREVFIRYIFQVLSLKVISFLHLVLRKKKKIFSNTIVPFRSDDPEYQKGVGPMDSDSAYCSESQVR